MSQYESKEEQQKEERLEKIKQAKANENIRLKALNLKRKLSTRIESPLGSSRKVQPAPKQRFGDELLPRMVKRTVRAWLEAPTVDMDLGRKIVLELAANGIEIYESML